jgi:hypothetical protein
VRYDRKATRNRQRKHSATVEHRQNKVLHAVNKMVDAVVSRPTNVAFQDEALPPKGVRQLADDNIDHGKLMLAVKKHVPEKWVRLYIQRWLETPVLTKSGKLLEKDGSGTPQGGVISPLLANLFRGYELSKVFRLLRIRIVRWVRKRYKRYRTSLTKACKWLDRVRVQYPNLFYHWQVGYSN